ncbi:MAG: D-tyrosyl-tRNA(Tyr) deacylase [Bacteroidia bacterium]|jgi:D-tyrosyl-tRNA(Tyr) deacylase|nr:D-tyrosyl-tRNA(Tyr) deacylase [Bacteroidia bacterium]MCC6768666.1 D-tyrosyl-tRNA(Tyr) deacylase [Bacteroidia bacterium]
MRAVIQRVNKASVNIAGKQHARIEKGLLVLLGVGEDDLLEDAIWLAAKIAGMRIFSDKDGLMNLSVNDIHGEAMVISQFTLFASTKKGNRPSFIRAGKPEMAAKLYEMFCQQLTKEMSRTVKTGVFAADMQIELINDGPVTILIDSKTRE